MSYMDIDYCLGILNEKPTWFFGKDKVAEKLQCFDIIQKNGTPGTIYHLIGFLKDNNLLIQEKAAETILHLFSKLDSLSSYDGSLKHLNIAKGDLDIYRVNFGEKIYTKLLNVASLNGSGYVREKAVKEFGRLKDTGSLKFLLLRLGDWTPAVRKAANKALNYYLNEAYIDELLKHFPTIDSLLNVKRVDLAETHNRIIQFILHQEFSEDFYNKIKHLDDKARLSFYIHLFKHTTPGKKQTGLILKDKNFLIRLEILKKCSQFDQEFQKELITRFLHDPSAKIRVHALYATKPFHPGFDERIMILLSDRSASVRELCRQLLKSKGLNFAAIYSERIKEDSLLYGSLGGLSETGTKEDLPVFEQYIDSPNSEVIISCLTAINKHDPDSARLHALALLTHPIKRIRNKTIEILVKGCDSGTLEKIRQTYAAGDYEIRETILKLYNAMGGWNVIGDLLIALTDENNKIQNLGWQLLVKWKDNARKLFTTPISAEIERANNIYKQLDVHKNKLTGSRAKLLEDLLFYLR